MKAARTVLIILCLTAGLSVAAGGAALAMLGSAPALAAGSGPVSMDQAVRMVEERFQARVVKAETQKDGERTVYALRLYNKSSGKVWTVHVDAADGSIH